MSIRKVKANLTRFRSRKNPRILLPFPVSSALRLVQLSPGGPAFANVQPVLLNHWSDLPSLEPNVVIGSLTDMQRLADYAARGLFNPACIDHALVVLTRYGADPLTDIMRVTLWQRFGVPIFELYVGLDQTLLASECEAHEGWHLAPGIGSFTIETGELVLEGAGNAGLRTGLRASLDEKTCPCGHTAPRLLEIEPVYRLGDYLAASA